jgi:hypothetical protein
MNYKITLNTYVTSVIEGKLLTVRWSSAFVLVII